MASSISAMPTLAASTAERDRAFKGSHNVDGYIFNVFYSTFDAGTGWYWCKVLDGMCSSPKGPFPTAEGAYLSAIGE